MNTKFYIGPMSKNTVDACIAFCNNYNMTIGLIPSRRQIDYNSGYVNEWTTKTFSNYVKNASTNITLQRDHGGPGQGTLMDDGYESLTSDCKHLHLIHVDPWKICKNFQNGCELTAQYIKYCYQLEPRLKYEVGTEQSIFEYSSQELNDLLEYLKQKLSSDEYSKIIYAVIQSGTSLKGNTNTGTYDPNKLENMVSVCQAHGLHSKEHNGDYLPIELIYQKFSLGLNSINIAPELGQIETKTYLNEIGKNQELFNTFFDICYSSKKWEKWVNTDFDPFSRKEEMINISGHYVLSTGDFLTQIKSKIRPDVDDIIKKNITTFLVKLHKL